jgi:hypothetical protein
LILRIDMNHLNNYEKFQLPFLFWPEPWNGVLAHKINFYVLFRSFSDSNAIYFFNVFLGKTLQNLTQNRIIVNNHVLWILKMEKFKKKLKTCGKIKIHVSITAQGIWFFFIFARVSHGVPYEFHTVPLWIMAPWIRVNVFTRISRVYLLNTLTT